MESSTLAILLSLLFTTLLSFTARLLLLSNQSRRRLPPGPPPLPIIGNLHMLGHLPHRSLRRLSARYGPIMSLRLGLVPTVVVSSPKAAKAFLGVHDAIFASRPKSPEAELDFYTTKGLVFTEYGPYWRSVRKLCTTRLLNAARVRSFEGVRMEEVGSLVASLKESAAVHEAVDLSARVARAMEDMACRMILGRSTDGEHDLKGIIQEAARVAGTFNLADYVPFLRPLNLQGSTRQFKAVRRSVDKLLEKIIDDHVQDAAHYDSKHQQDFIAILLSMMNQPIDPREEKYIIERSNIKAIILDMISGSFETSSTSIDWAFSELMRHPQAMARLQGELEAIVGLTRMVEESDLPKLNYLDMVVKESMRLHPVIPLLVPRESMEDAVINECFIPKKSRIIVNVWAIGRDPSVWSENAEEFVPERFADNGIDVKGNHFELLPFGSGRRGCPGIQLGLIQVKLVLAQLAHCFKWELPDDMVPSDIDTSERFGLSVPRANHLLSVPTYRLLV
ncbi:cytochrome P450 CYP736A12-like [Syzygium oleosum]|uniref:cytochrome P450 CYP736A12-like n=1 Tax=Syzygium oleosum TaxID=219896 RepID=UPI0011D1BD5A|nr:cytochrome P450 CYP736A12-like [Syzygium oleosum]